MTKRIIPPQSITHDLAGLKKNRWTVLEYVRRSDCGSAMWLCKCDCGTIKEVAGTTVVTGKSKSCGCLAAERTSVRTATHRLSKTTEHKIWLGMRNRVLSTKDTSYKNYGGRGITICAEWDDFLTFLADMGERPTPKHSIDRRDNEGNYTPDNCYWATPRQQATNKRNNINITRDGVTKCLKDWCTHQKLPYKTVWYRINGLNWPIERALTEPVRR